MGGEGNGGKPAKPLWAAEEGANTGVLGRCTHLLHCAYAIAAANPALAACYFVQVRSVARAADLELAESVEQLTCGVCSIPLVPGWTCRVRSHPLAHGKRPARNSLMVCCRNCGTRERFPGTRANVRRERAQAHALAVAPSQITEEGQFFVDRQPTKPGSKATFKKGDKAQGRALPVATQGSRLKKERRQALQRVLAGRERELQAATQPAAALKDFLSSLQ